MKGSANPPGDVPCPGCPIYPHIPDEQFRFPSCELCHWPAIGVGSIHVWRCAYCRHRNQHGFLRPRVSAVLLRLAGLDPAARRLEIVDVRYGRYLLPRARPSPCQPRGPWRPGLTAPAAGPGRAGGGGQASDLADAAGTGRAGAGLAGAGGPQWRRAAGHHHAGRPVYARATVADLPVLIVGGDRPYPHPLGLAEHDLEPCAFGSRATRIACPCDQPAPCLHGQALYAHVVSPIAVPPLPSARSPRAAGLSRPAC